MIKLRNQSFNTFSEKKLSLATAVCCFEMRMRPGGVNDKVLIKKYAEVFSLGHPRKYIHVSLRF